MLFYHVQIKGRHDSGVNIKEKASIASINEAGGSSKGGWGFNRGGGWDFNEARGKDFRGQNALRKLL